jgi:ribosome-binding protein aMBF1 (putative translation factor)
VGTSCALGRGVSESRSGNLRYGRAMPVCKGCGDEVDALVSVKVDGKSKKLCEDCADRANEQSEIAEQSEGAVQQMMGFKGRR